MSKVKLPSVFQLVWGTYTKNSLIPMLLISIVLLAAYFVSISLIRDANVEFAEEYIHREVENRAVKEAALLASQLESVERSTQLLADYTLTALNSPIDAPKSERERYQFDESGAWYTAQDNGGAALFYSSVTEVGPEQKEKAWRLMQTDHLMQSLVDSETLITQAYFNSHDSLNRIYPYFDVISQYPLDIDIPAYNFYYEADKLHNPSKEAVWTNVYADPAGQGWMVSSIAPVYNGDFLEGVVGLDITVRDVIDKVLTMKLPWVGYPVLIDREGTVLALPEAAEQDWGLKELTDFSYEEAIKQDTFKPDDFNIFKRSDTQELAFKLGFAGNGSFEIDFAGKNQLIASQTVGSSGWRLIIFADEAQILDPANALKERFDRVGYTILIGLIIVYFLFFGFIYKKSLKLSRQISQPLETLSSMMEGIGRGEYRQIGRHFKIKEIQQTSDGLVAMGERLEQSSEHLKHARDSLKSLNKDLESRVIHRTQQLERANAKLHAEKGEQTKLIDQLHEAQEQLIQSEKLASLGQLAAGVAHEINNPLSFISSNVGSLRGYSDSLLALISELDKRHHLKDKEIQDLKETYQFELIKEDLPDLIEDSIEGVRRVRTIVENLRDFSHTGNNEWQSANINESVQSALTIVTNEVKYKADIVTQFSELPSISCIPGQIGQIVLNLVINASQAMKHTRGTITISTYAQEAGVVLEVRDNGSGMDEATKAKIFDPFFTTKAIGEGTGLGLSISYGIVNNHKGHINVDTEIGVGTTFTIWLPLEQHEKTDIEPV